MVVSYNFKSELPDTTSRAKVGFAVVMIAAARCATATTSTVGTKFVMTHSIRCSLR